MRQHAFGLLAALAFAAPTLRAQTVAAQTGTVYQTQSMKSSSTYATDMQGMRVSAHFADGHVVQGLSWDALDVDGTEWGVSSSRFRLSMLGGDNTGSELSHVWKLENLAATGLTRLVISGAPGRTVFDRVYEDELTPNSARGLPLSFAPIVLDDYSTLPNPYAATSTVTYRNAVALVGASALFDLYEEVDLAFANALTGEIRFDLDSDTIGDGAALDPAPGPNGPGGPSSTVPEPASVALLATGLLAIGGVGLKRRRAA